MKKFKSFNNIQKINRKTQLKKDKRAFQVKWK